MKTFILKREQRKTYRVYADSLEKAKAMVFTINPVSVEELSRDWSEEPPELHFKPDNEPKQADYNPCKFCTGRVICDCFSCYGYQKWIKEKYSTEPLERCEDCSSKNICGEPGRSACQNAARDRFYNEEKNRALRKFVSEMPFLAPKPLDVANYVIRRQDGMFYCPDGPDPENSGTPERRLAPKYTLEEAREKNREV